MKSNVVTRFAPSPTGLPHIGTAMYALLNFLYARQHDGTVIMRSEDTDPVRSKPEYEEAIIAGLGWLGITADAFYRQSERTELYKKYIAKMVADGTAYISKEINETGQTRDVVRFKNPNKVVTFNDASRGDIAVDTTDLKDFVIARDVESPLYHLTVVVDDFEMGVTHIIRGEDGIANTPRQILIQEAIGAPRPLYAHYPFVLLPNKTKMGKRNGAVSLQEYRSKGYLPEALLNFVILMAWHPKDDRELFTLTDLLSEFELSRIGKSGAILDEKKLNWLNREYIKKLSPDAQLTLIEEYLPERIKNYKNYSTNLLKKTLPIILERIDKFDDVRMMAEAGEFDYVFEPPTPSRELLTHKLEVDTSVIAEHLKHAKDQLSRIEAFDKESLKNLLWEYATEAGRANVLWPMRVALTGLPKSPDPFTVAEILGKDETIKRLTYAEKLL